MKGQLCEGPKGGVRDLRIATGYVYKQRRQGQQARRNKRGEVDLRSSELAKYCKADFYIESVSITTNGSVREPNFFDSYSQYIDITLFVG